MANYANFQKHFSCENCEYTTRNKKDFHTHLFTAKHKKVLIYANVQEKCPDFPPEHNSQFSCIPDETGNDISFGGKLFDCEDDENADPEHNSQFSCLPDETGNDISFGGKLFDGETASQHEEDEFSCLDDEKQAHTSSGGKLFDCKQCGKTYKHTSSLCRHKKFCQADCGVSINKSGKMELTNQRLIFKLLKENKEFKTLIVEQNKMLMKPTTTIVNNYTNNTSSTTQTQHNKFNLQFFLNETCKNAMNINDFVDSLVIQSHELEDMGKLGYAQGISNIIIRGLKALDETERPLHCTDKKRETLYIKFNNVWEKVSNQEKMRQLVKDISHKNFKRLPEWMKDNPACDDTTSKKHVEYMYILNQVMTGLGPEDDVGIKKVVKNISCYVYLNR